jgi:UTP--glucose-1-phosphate uridylyltransferase
VGEPMFVRPATDVLAASLDKMRASGAPEAAVEAFSHSYQRRRGGDPAMLAERDLEPARHVPDLECLGVTPKVLDRVVVLKLNGGLGTSMGLSRAKSLLEVKEGLTFLDVIALQMLCLRDRTGARLPLVLMNSFATHAATVRALARYPDLAADVPLTFKQNRFPKLWPDDLGPVTWEADPALEWAPPGDGDLYASMPGSGMLERLLDRGYRYAFVSNSDNLGATLEPRILAWFASEGVPFLMEVADRTDADRKRGHLARRRGEGLVLRERAQTPEQDMPAFQDVHLHRFFNTNNLWLNLRALSDTLERRQGILSLPLIVNRKPIDPSDPSTPEVLQLEFAMGAAISMFPGAQALRVPRRRFAPVKTTDDLLAVRSDAYALDGEGHLELALDRGERPPIVELDPGSYKLLSDFEARFPAGPPSLDACQRLRVDGDVRFGRGVVIRGSVVIGRADGEPLQIADGTVLAA